MCGSGGFAGLGPGPVQLGEVAAARLAHDPVAALHLADQVGEHVGGQARRGDDRRQQVRDVLVVVELDLLGVDQDQAHLVGRGLHQDRGEDRVDAAGLARAGGAGDEHVRHLRQVGPDRRCRRSPCRARRPAARSSPGGRRRCRRGGRCGGACSAPRPRPPACRGSAPGCGCRSRRARRRGRWPSSVTFFTLVPGRQAQLVAGDVRAADDADDLRLDAEVAERLDQLAADRFVVARVGALVGPCPSRAPWRRAAGSRSPPRSVTPRLLPIGVRAAAGLGVGSTDPGRLLASDLDLVACELLVEARRSGSIGLDRRSSSSARSSASATVGSNRPPRDRRSSRRSAPAGSRRPSVFSSRRSSRCWIAVWATPRPPRKTRRRPRPMPRKSGRDRGAGDQHAADDAASGRSQIRAPTFAEQVVEPGFEPVADLAAVPAEEEDEASRRRRRSGRARSGRGGAAPGPAADAAAAARFAPFGFRLSARALAPRFLRTNMGPLRRAPLPLRSHLAGMRLTEAKFDAKCSAESGARG